MKFIWTLKAYLLLALFGMGALLLMACSDQSGTDSNSTVQVKSQEKEQKFTVETFNVGDSVYVRSLAAEPSNQAMWVGTSAGVHEIDLKTLKPRNTFTRDHGLANEYVFGIGIDQQGYKWFGTNAGGVSRYKDGEWKTYFPMHGLADYWIYCFATLRDKELWIGTWAGANHVNLDTMEFTTYVEELVNEWVYGIDVDSKNRVWFGTEGGISMFDGENWREWTHADGLGASNASNLPASPNTGLGTRSRHDLGILSGGLPTYNPNYVFSLVVASDDSVWAGTWGAGVSHFDGETFTNFTVADGLAGDIVYSLTIDKDDVLWIGTNGGLSRFDGVRWSTFTRADGLASNDVYAVTIDPEGKVWAGTRGGVSIVRPQ